MVGPSPLSVCVLVLIELSVLSGVFAAAAASVCSSPTADSFAPTPQYTNTGVRPYEENTMCAYYRQAISVHFIWVLLYQMYQNTVHSQTHQLCLDKYCILCILTNI